MTYFSHKSNGQNQRRDIKCMITEAVVATYETGNDASKLSAQQTADAAQAATVASLISGGYLKANATFSYTLNELQAAYARSIA
jgi:hypothetical protein